MKVSKLMHVLSALVGLAGVIVFICILLAGPNSLVFGITRYDALACDAILFLIAIWSQIATIHHMMLEKKGQLI